jgi:hypothetical protein
MSMYALLRSKGGEKITEAEMQNCLTGNLWYVYQMYASLLGPQSNNM